jgi:hypothetical protein
LNVTGVVVTKTSWGRKIANRQIVKVTLTGWGNTFAPKKGAMAIMGIIRPKKRNISEKKETGS